MVLLPSRHSFWQEVQRFTLPGACGDYFHPTLPRGEGRGRAAWLQSARLQVRRVIKQVLQSTPNTTHFDNYGLSMCVYLGESD